MQFDSEKEKPIIDEMVKHGLFKTDVNKPLKYDHFVTINGKRTNIRPYNISIPFGFDFETLDKLFEMIDEIYGD